MYMPHFDAEKRSAENYFPDREISTNVALGWRRIILLPIKQETDARTAGRRNQCLRKR